MRDAGVGDVWIPFRNHDEAQGKSTFDKRQIPTGYRLHREEADWPDPSGTLATLKASLGPPTPIDIGKISNYIHWPSSKTGTRKSHLWSIAYPAMHTAQGFIPIKSHGVGAGGRRILNADTDADYLPQGSGKDEVMVLGDGNVPPGTDGIVVGGTDINGEYYLFLPAMTTLIAQHLPDNAHDYSTNVADMDGNTSSQIYNAGLHTAWAVVLNETNAPTITINATQSAAEQTGWMGMRFNGYNWNNQTTSSGNSGYEHRDGVHAYGSWERYGFVHPGEPFGKHSLGSSIDGESWNSAAIWTNAIFYMDPVRTAPLEFTTEPDPRPETEGWMPWRVYLCYDDQEKHDWEQGKRDGLWRWHVKLAWEPPSPETPPPEPPPSGPITGPGSSSGGGGSGGGGGGGQPTGQWIYQWGPNGGWWQWVGQGPPTPKPPNPGGGGGQPPNAGGGGNPNNNNNGQGGRRGNNNNRPPNNDNDDDDDDDRNKGRRWIKPKPPRINPRDQEATLPEYACLDLKQQERLLRLLERGAVKMHDTLLKNWLRKANARKIRQEKQAINEIVKEKAKRERLKGRGVQVGSMSDLIRDLKDNRDAAKPRPGESDEDRLKRLRKRRQELENSIGITYPIKGSDYEGSVDAGSYINPDNPYDGVYSTTQEYNTDRYRDATPLSSPWEMSVPSLLGRAYPLSATMPRWNRYGQMYDGSVKAYHMAPFTGHFQFFGSEGPSNKRWSYTTEPNSGERFKSGTADGGVWFTPPEVMLGDADLDPASGLSTTYFGLHPDVSLAWGTPNSSGVIVSGFSISTGVDVNGDDSLIITALDSAGAGETASHSITIGDYLIPLTDGSADQVLVTDGAGVTTWTSIGTGLITWPLQGPDDGDPAYMFDGATVPGSTNAGMKWDTVSDEGPALFDLTGAAQLRVKTGEIVVTGKLTVAGLIDPTGLVFTEQGSSPSTLTAGQAMLWTYHTGGIQSPMFTNDGNTSHYMLHFDSAGSWVDNEILRNHAGASGIQQRSNLRILDKNAEGYTEDHFIEAFGSFGTANGESIGIKGEDQNHSSYAAGSVYVNGGDHSSLSGGTGSSIYINRGSTIAATAGRIYLGNEHSTEVEIGASSKDCNLNFYERSSMPTNEAALFKVAAINRAPNTLEGEDDAGGNMYLGVRHHFAFAYRDTSNQRIAHATWTKVQLNAEAFDTEGSFDSTTNYRFQPTVPGYYQFNWNVEFSIRSSGGTEVHPYGASAPASMVFKTAIYRNVARTADGSTDGFNKMPFEEPPAEYPESHGSAIYYMDGSTHYVELYAYAENTSALDAFVRTGSARTYFTAHLVNKL